MALAAKRLGITGETLKQLDSELYNKLGGAFRAACSQSQKDAYKNMKTDAERADALAVFALGPAEFEAQGSNVVTSFNETVDENEGSWVMESQLGGPQFPGCSPGCFFEGSSGGILNLIRFRAFQEGRESHGND